MKIKVNDDLTTTETITAQMLEPRPLPMGRQEFEEWSDRIISGALVSADTPHQKFCLADMLTHLGPTESHKPDAYFIHCLRKFAINQTAIEIKNELKKAHEAKVAAEEEARRAALTPQEREWEDNVTAIRHNIGAPKTP